MTALGKGLVMTDKYEYQVCQVYEDRVLWVNGRWAGDTSLEECVAVLGPGWNSCPRVCTYLNDAGQEGWELVAVVSDASETDFEYGRSVQKVYLKRRRP